MKDWNSRITELVVLVKPMLREMSRPLRIMTAWKILTKRLEMSVLPTEMFAFTLRPLLVPWPKLPLATPSAIPSSYWRASRSAVWTDLECTPSQGTSAKSSRLR